MNECPVMMAEHKQPDRITQQTKEDPDNAYQATNQAPKKLICIIIRLFDKGYMHFRSHRLAFFTDTHPRTRLFFTTSLSFTIFFIIFFHTVEKFTRNLISMCMCSKRQRLFELLEIFFFPWKNCDQCYL